MTLPPRLPANDRDECGIRCAYHADRIALMRYYDLPLCETCYQHVLSDVLIDARIQQLISGGLPHDALD